MLTLQSIHQRGVTDPVEHKNGFPETQSALRDQQLRVAQIAQNGFISRDMQARLNVTDDELFAIRQSAGRLLGGDRKIVVQDHISLEPGETFNSETDRSRGRKVYIDTKDKVHITVIYDSNRVLINGPFTGTKNFAEGLSDGHFQLTLKNTTAKTISVYVHVEDEDPGDCVVM